jgi:hypothetical protein
MIGQGKAIVLSYINSWKDETQRAKYTAEQTNLPLTEISLPQFDSKQIAQYVDYLDEPLGGTCGFAVSHLCGAILPGSWIIAGHGSGALSLTNFKNKHLRDAELTSSNNNVEESFAQLATFMNLDSRKQLLGNHWDSQWAHPIIKLYEKENQHLKSNELSLLALIRRQLCVEEEMSQLWAIYEAFGHIPVMPFFEPEVRSLLDKLPVSVLRNDQYERKLLEGIASKYCSSYIKPPRQLGYGLPLGLMGYPNLKNMKEAVDVFSHGPFSKEGLVQLTNNCKGKDGAELFNSLRRLWTVIILHAWLEKVSPPKSF